VLTNYEKVAVLGKHLAPGHAFHADVAIVLLSGRLVKEVSKEEERHQVRVVQQIVRRARQTLYDKVRQIRV
jgi:hypothetical protein